MPTPALEGRPASGAEPAGRREPTPITSPSLLDGDRVLPDREGVQRLAGLFVRDDPRENGQEFRLGMPVGRRPFHVRRQRPAGRASPRLQQRLQPRQRSTRRPFGVVRIGARSPDLAIHPSLRNPATAGKAATNRTNPTKREKRTRVFVVPESSSLFVSLVEFVAIS